MICLRCYLREGKWRMTIDNYGVEEERFFCDDCLPVMMRAIEDAQINFGVKQK